MAESTPKDMMTSLFPNIPCKSGKTDICHCQISFIMVTTTTDKTDRLIFNQIAFPTLAPNFEIRASQMDQLKQHSKSKWKLSSGLLLQKLQVISIEKFLEAGNVLVLKPFKRAIQA